MSTPPVSSLITRGLWRNLGVAVPPACHRQAWEKFKNRFLKFGSIDADLFSDLGLLSSIGTYMFERIFYGAGYLHKTTTLKNFSR